MLTVERARDLLFYDPETGEFRWCRSLGTARSGMAAGHFDAEGYRRIKIDGRHYRAHRLAWLLVHGRWPEGVVDHINGDPGDNRLINLREATPMQNGANRKRAVANTSGRTGVHWDARDQRWRATIKVGGRQRSLGLFEILDEAVAARAAAEAEHFGQFARAG